MKGRTRNGKRERLALVFGDSWADGPETWPQWWAAKEFPAVYAYAMGGSTSQDLIAQAALCAHNWQNNFFPESTLAIIHTGGNDLQHALGCGGVFGPVYAFLLALIQTLFWCALRLITAPCYLCCKRRWAGELVNCLSRPIVCMSMRNGVSASFTPDLMINNIHSLMEELNTFHGIRIFVVAGLPVTPCLPLMQHLLSQWQPQCIHSLANAVVRLWVRCGVDLQAAMCDMFQRTHPECRVLFFDEAEAIERLVQNNLEHATEGGSTSCKIWQDFLHLSDHGHRLLAEEFAQLWNTWEPQEDLQE